MSGKVCSGQETKRGGSLGRFEKRREVWVESKRGGRLRPGRKKEGCLGVWAGSKKGGRFGSGRIALILLFDPTQAPRFLRSNACYRVYYLNALNRLGLKNDDEKSLDTSKKSYQEWHPTACYQLIRRN